MSRHPHHNYQHVIMVIDTQGPGELSLEYRTLMPFVDIIGEELSVTKGERNHPHGAFCGWNAACLQHPNISLAQGAKSLLIFVRTFDSNAMPISDAPQFILDMVAKHQPHYVSRSWGAWDQDSERGKAFQESRWGDWVPEWQKLQKKIDFVDFGAAGNKDANDVDTDIDYPQALLTDTSCIIGSCKRGGKPSKFSGDGLGLLHLMWGENVYSPDNQGKWHVWSGTSRACPWGCGLAAANGHTTETYRRYVEVSATKPTDWDGKPHPKYGWGSMEDEAQKLLRKLPRELWPPESVGTEIAEYVDYEKA